MANLFSIAGAVGPRFQLPVRPRIGLVARSSSVGLRLLMSRSGRLGPDASSLSQAGSPAGRHSYPHRAFHHSPVRQDVVFLAIPVCRMVRSCEKLRSGELTRRPGPPSVGAQVSPADGDKGDARHATFCLAVEVSRSWASSSDLKKQSLTVTACSADCGISIGALALHSYRSPYVQVPTCAHNSK